MAFVARPAGHTWRFANDYEAADAVAGTPVSEPQWLTPEVLQLLREELIAEHGRFIASTPDEAGASLLREALAAPRRQWAQAVRAAAAQGAAADAADLESLAATLACALVHCPAAHPCLALAAMDVFLRLNDRRVPADEGEAAGIFRELAAGLMLEQGLARWLRRPGTLL